VRTNGIHVRSLKTKAWLVSAVLHIAAGVSAVLVTVRQVQSDYITVTVAAEPLELELSVDLVSDELQTWQQLLEDAPDRVQISIDPPDVLLQKPVDELTYEDIRELIRMSAEQGEQRSPEEQVDALAWWLQVDQAVVSDGSAAEITDKVKQALGVEEREFEPLQMAKINELDHDTVVPYYRITEQPAAIIQIVDLNPNGDYRIFDEKPLHELYDIELAEYRKYQEAAAENQSDLVQTLMKREEPHLEPTAETTRHFRTLPRPPGRYFQAISVDARGRYRIMTEKPESEMTILEWARLRAFQLTEDPRHRGYREAVLGAAGNDSKKP
jgi:hypothetical protein